MICVLQRVLEAHVSVDGREIARIGAGMVVLAAECADDDDSDVLWTARKLASLRMFADGDRNFDKDILEKFYAMLLVSNFTVAAEAAKGRRPSLSAAAPPDIGRARFDELVASVRSLGVNVQTGQFGADMRVSLLNDGPVTFLLNSRDK